MSKILVYTQKSSNRLSYVLKVFSQLLGLDFSLTQNQDVFERFDGPKIYYSTQPQNNYSIQAQSLLFEHDVKQQNPAVSKHKEVTVLYPGKGQLLSFDIFSASFFLLSRYEEYLPNKKDKHGRFKARNSLAFRHGFLEQPIVNLWVELLKEALLRAFPGFSFPIQKHRANMTIDVDQPFAFKHKPLSHLLLSSVQNLVKGQFNKQIAVLQQKIQDPYDQFSFIASVSKKYKLPVTYFIHVGKRGKYDPKNPTKLAFKSLLKSFPKTSTIGIHPSYKSNASPKVLEREIKFLASLSEKKINHSRQHFIKFSLPLTFESLIKQGITHEYSMGYPEIPGFRAGIANPYPWFNLLENKTRPLTLVPFWFMDKQLNSKDYSLKWVQHQIAALKKLALEHCLVFHSHFFALDQNLESNKNNFEQILEHVH